MIIQIIIIIMNDNDHLNNDYNNERLLQCWQVYQDLQDDSDNGNDDWIVICFQGQIQKRKKNRQNSIDLWSHLLFGIIWRWKKGSFKFFWSNLAPRETINVRLIQFSNQIETIGAQECLINILSITIVIKKSFSTKLKLVQPKSA